MPSEKRPGKGVFLEAGAKLLRDAQEVVANAIPSLDKVADAAGGFTKQSLQYHWPLKKNYVEALLLYLLSPDRNPSLWPLREAIRRLADSDNLVADLRAFLRTDFETWRDDPGYGLQLIIMGGSPNRDVQAGLRRLYHEFDDFLAPDLEFILDAWGRQPVHPFTVQRLAIMFNALIDGFALRARFDPTRATADIYSDAALSLLLMTTEPRGEGGRMADRLAPIDDWVIVSG
jgi:hypothetical protein